MPGEDLSDFGAFIAADKSDVATAFFARSTEVAAQIAQVLGRDVEAKRYRVLSEAVVRCLARRVRRHRRARSARRRRPTWCVRSRFGLVPSALRQAAVDRLDAMVRENGTRLATGFLSTPDLLPVLADGGHLDTAYDLLFQDQAPSWMTMIDRGATTVWERWEGIDEDGVPHESLNHYSKGAVVSFLHRYVVGLQRTSPTWRTFRVEPRPGGGLTWARASHDSPHGLVAASWSLSCWRLRARRHRAAGLLRRGGAAVGDPAGGSGDALVLSSARTRTISLARSGRGLAVLVRRHGLCRSVVAERRASERLETTGCT